MGAAVGVNVESARSTVEAEGDSGSASGGEAEQAPIPHLYAPGELLYLRSTPGASLILHTPVPSKHQKRLSIFRPVPHEALSLAACWHAAGTRLVLNAAWSCQLLTRCRVWRCVCVRGREGRRDSEVPADPGGPARPALSPHRAQL